MKKILLACGSGICTSTAVCKRIEKFLDSNGYQNAYEITQCKVAEVPAMSDKYDFLISTTMAPANLNCPYVNGVPFLMGVDVQDAEESILKLMEV
jgi:PTS system galactitol-specific IIB component